MTAENRTGSAGTNAATTDGVGAMLRARREALGLAQADVAQVVKLPARRIDALEDERWDELPSGPYLRGFLRNVARALDLDATSLMDRVDASLVSSRSPDSILVRPNGTNVRLPRRSGPADDRRGGRALVFGAISFALLAALIAWSGTASFDQALATGKAFVDARNGATRPAADVVPGPARDVPVAPAEAVVASSSLAASPSGSAAAPAVAPAADPGAATATTDASAAAAGSAGATSVPAGTSSSLALAFHFSEDAWVEVRSADGKVLLKRLATAGSEQEVDGQAPFTLVVGNAKGVALRFRGQPVDLGPYTRDQVARFKLS